MRKAAVDDDLFLSVPSSSPSITIRIRGCQELEVYHCCAGTKIIFRGWKGGNSMTKKKNKRKGRRMETKRVYFTQRKTEESGDEIRILDTKGKVKYRLTRISLLCILPPLSFIFSSHLPFFQITIAK